MEGWLFDVWREKRKNTRTVRRQRKNHVASIEEKAAFTNETSTSSCLRIILLLLFYSLYFTLCCQAQSKKWEYILCWGHQLRTTLVSWHRIVGIVWHLLQTKFNMRFNRSTCSSSNVIPEVHELERLLRPIDALNESSYYTDCAPGNNLPNEA